MYRGARISPTATQNYTTTGAYDTLRFAQADYDTDGLWSAGQPNRLTIPAGVSKVRLRLGLKVDSADVIPASNAFRFRLNGTDYTFAGNLATSINAGGYTNPGDGLVSDIIDVVEGDYFEAVYSVAATFSLDPVLTWFAVEIVEMTDDTAYRTTDLLDVVTTEPTDGQVLVYDAAEKKYVPGTPSVTVPEGASIYKPFRGALIHRTTDTGSLNGNYSPVVWQAADYDTDGFWSAGSPSRLTIPTGSGIKRVRLIGSVDTTNLTGNTLARILKNGGTAFPGMMGTGGAAGYTNTPFAAATSAINVEEGDYFEFSCIAADTAWNVVAARSSFAIEVVEAEEPIP